MRRKLYERHELPGRVHITRPGEPPIEASLRRVSAAGAVVESDFAAPRGARLEVRLELPGAAEEELVACALRSGGDGLFLAWDPPEEALHRRLGELLERCARVHRDERPAHTEGCAADPANAQEGARETRATTSDPAAASGSPSPEAATEPRPEADVESRLRGRARPVSARELAQQYETVHVLGLSTVEELIEGAVQEAAGRMARELDDEERERLKRETEALFEERMVALQAEKQDLESAVTTLDEQLRQAQQLLDEERARVIDPERFTVSAEGLRQLTDRFERLLDGALRRGAVSESLEDDLRRTVSRLLDDERQRIAMQAALAQNDTVLLLERKVQRLAEHLEETRQERDRARAHASALEAQGSGPLSNIYEPGLQSEDPQRETKLELLRELMQDNHDLRAYARGRNG